MCGPGKPNRDPFPEVPIPESRRRLLMTFVGTVGILAVDLFWPPGKLRACAEAPQRRPSPNASHPNFPPGLDGQLAKGPDTKAIDCENQKEVKVRRFETP